MATPSDDLKQMTALADAAIKRTQEGQQNEENRRTRRFSKFAIGIAAASAIFTFWQGFEARQSRLAFVRQADEARRDSKDAAKQASDDAREIMRLQAEQGKQALELAQRSANAAIESNRLSMKALAVSQAANVTVQSFDLSRPLAPGQNVEASVTLLNRGNVPAETTLVLGLLDPVTNGGYGLRDFPHALNVFVGDTLVFLDKRVASADRKPSGPQIPFADPMKLVLPPGAWTTHYISTEARLDEHDVKAVKDGIDRIYVVAFIEFHDGFGETKRRGFCGVYDGRSSYAGGFNVCTGFRFEFGKGAFQEPNSWIHRAR
jgi:hypothetical protein